MAMMFFFSRAEESRTAAVSWENIVPVKSISVMTNRINGMVLIAARELRFIIRSKNKTIFHRIKGNLMKGGKYSV